MARSSASLSFSKSSSIELTCSAIRPSLRRSLPSPARMTLSMMAGTSRRAPRGSGCEGVAARGRAAGSLPPWRLAGTALSTAIVGESPPKSSRAGPAAWLPAMPGGPHTHSKHGGRGHSPARPGHNNRVAAVGPPPTVHPRGAERMADQANPGPVVGVGQEGGALAQTGPDTYQAPEVFHGRTVSWVAVSIIAA